MRIHSAVMSCPREVSYLDQTMHSLYGAGFAPILVYDNDRQGSHPTMRHAMQELLKTPADVYVLFQDDIQVSAELYSYVASELWPESEDAIGVVSLYTPAPRHNDGFGWFLTEPSARIFGGLAYCFPRHAMERYLERTPNPEFLTLSDSCIAEFCKREKLSYWEHSPSLVMHLGWVSAIDKRNKIPFSANIWRNRQCKQFVPDLCKPGSRLEFNVWQE